MTSPRRRQNWHPKPLLQRQRRAAPQSLSCEFGIHARGRGCLHAGSEDDVHQRKGATGPKTEKEKRKPAKLRRMSLEKQIVGILRQGKGLDDAVPAQNQDKLSARIEDVEKTLHPFVEEGKVADVHELLLASWGLVSELFTL